MNNMPEVFPADPTQPCPISWLPVDLWFHISQYVASDQSSEFVVTTAQTVDSTSAMPLAALHDDADLVLCGVPANGMLYITSVPDESDEIREVFNERTQQMVGDLGPWFAKIHRHFGGQIDVTRTPLCNRATPRHRFYVEATASHAVRLHISPSEDGVIEEWHDSSELRPASSRETGNMRTRLSVRRDNIVADDDMRFLKVSGASTKACKGQLTVLALCKALKIKAKLEILGTLPLMARLDLENPVDQLSTMEHPYDLKTQMSYNLGKWLMLVPAKWIICNQNTATQHVLTMEERASGVIPSVARIREWARVVPERRPAANNPDRFLDRIHVAMRPNDPPMKYAMTSFKTIAPVMVYAFFSCANRFVSLTSDSETWRLIRRAQEDGGFREEFSVTGPHVTPATLCGHLAVTKAGVAAPADASPEMALFGGFDGIF